MQKLATRTFICASVLFGFLGVFLVLTGIDPDENSTGPELILTKFFVCSIFVILTSFALSVAGRFLNGRSS